MLVTKQNSSAAPGVSFGSFIGTERANDAPTRLLVGITSDQTCLVLKNRLRALKKAGFDITLVSSPGQRLTETAMTEGVSSVALPMLRGIAPLADMGSFFKLLWVIFQCHPEITDFSTPKAGFLGNLAAWVMRVPHRVYTLRGLKLEGTCGWKLRVLLWSERTACSCAHVVLCNSESLCNKAESLHLASTRKIRLLGNGSSNGVDIKRFSPGPSDVRHRFRITEDEPVLGFVGRLTRDKGLAELLIAFEQILLTHPRAWLLLVGWFDGSDDSLENRWRVHIATHPRIRHTGFVEDTVPYYRAMDLMILPTYREGFPNAVLEAAASGIPTIATECTGARDSVIDGITGYLVSPGNSEAISVAALNLLDDSRKRQKMGMAARQWAADLYDQRKVLGLAAEFYHSLLRDNSANWERSA